MMRTVFEKTGISAMRKPTLLKKRAFLQCGNRHFWKNGHFCNAETDTFGKTGISAMRKQCFEGKYAFLQ
jgi:hypothetical protein